MDSPRLNLVCQTALAGFCFRALANGASGTDAPLTTRLLENLQSDKTELMLSLSALKADIQIVRQRVIEAQQDAEDTKLDLRIFNDNNPAPPPRKGFFSKRLSTEQKHLERQRLELQQISEQCADDVSTHQNAAAALAGNLEQQSQALSEILAEQDQKTLELTSQVAAEVITRVVAGDTESARRRLASLRQLSRGNLMLGVLCVVVELLAAGPQGAKQALMDARLIFEQHPDPAITVLEGLIDLASPEPSLKKNPGWKGSEAYSSTELYLLSQLASALGGWRPDQTALAGDDILTTLTAIHELHCAGSSSEARQHCSVTELLTLSATNDLVVRTLCCSALLARNERQALVEAVGLGDLAQYQSAGKNATPLLLIETVKDIAAPAWPDELAAPWQSALACLALLGAQHTAPEPVFEAWLAESFGWPKNDLYWWVLAEIKQDKTLLRNISGSPTELFSVNPL